MFNKSASVSKPCVLQFNETKILCKSIPDITKNAAYVCRCCAVVTSLLVVTISTSLGVKPDDNNASTTLGVNALFFFNVANKLEG